MPNRHAARLAPVFLAQLLQVGLPLALAALLDHQVAHLAPLQVADEVPADGGAIDAGRPRELARRVQAGALGVIFPEGELDLLLYVSPELARNKGVSPASFVFSAASLL